MKDIECTLAFDLGGTKLAYAVIDVNGRMYEQQKEAVCLERSGEGLVEQIEQAAHQLLQKFPTVKKMGIASAGPLNPEHGELLDPTNLVTDGKSWGVFPLVNRLRGKIKNVSIRMENDAAAAVLAEHWLGNAKGCKNLLMLTLGTGIGVGALVNGSLVRCGRFLHPESSHIVLNAWDHSAPCGCGNYGCVEAYLSGKNFVSRLAQKWGMKDLTGEELVAMAERSEEKALQAFSDYAEQFALAVNSYVVLYAPEVITIAGGFAQAGKFFLPKAKTHLEQLLRRRRSGIDLMPKIELSSLKEEIGLLGAAYIARVSNY